MTTDIATIPKERIFEYLKKGSEMEANVFFLAQQVEDSAKKTLNLMDRLKKLKSEYPKEPQKPQEPAVYGEWGKASPGFKFLSVGGTILAIISIIIGIYVSRLPFFVYREGMAQGMYVEAIMAFVIYGMPIAALILWPVIAVIGKNISARIKFKQALQQAQQMNNWNQNRYEEAIKKYDADYAEYVCACAMFDEETETLEKMINACHTLHKELISKHEEAERQLQEFYSAGIIHPKYQGIVPIFRFYEYYDTGKCDTLKECMHTYDDEVFRDMVTTKLDQLIGAVNSMQYHLSAAISEMSGNIARLSGSFDALSGSVSATQAELAAQNYSNAMLAESAKRIANNTDTLRFYRELEWIKRG